MKDYLFSSTDGALYDTRDSNWSKNPPLRAVYRQHFQTIKTTAELKATLRAGPFSDLGGYPLYFITDDGAALSFDSVQSEFRNVVDSVMHKSRDGWRVVACDVNYEDDSLVCDHSGKRIPSAYGDAPEESA